MFCPRCGEKIDTSSRFCPRCGQDVTGNPCVTNAPGGNKFDTKTGKPLFGPERLGRNPYQATLKDIHECDATRKLEQIRAAFNDSYMNEDEVYSAVRSIIDS